MEVARECTNALWTVLIRDFSGGIRDRSFSCDPIGRGSCACLDSGFGKVLGVFHRGCVCCFGPEHCDQIVGAMGRVSDWSDVPDLFPGVAFAADIDVPAITQSGGVIERVYRAGNVWRELDLRGIFQGERRPVMKIAVSKSYPKYFSGRPNTSL